MLEAAWFQLRSYFSDDILITAFVNRVLETFWPRLMPVVLKRALCPRV